MTKLLLAIDTCTGTTSIALRDERRVVGEHTWPNDRRHTAAVSARIRDLVRAAGASFAAIGAIGVALGPGSFTGVRCGLAIAKGVAVASNAALIGVSAFDVIAAAQPRLDLPVLALIEAGRNRVAVQRFEWRDGALRPAGEWVLTPSADVAGRLAEPTWCCGDVPGQVYAEPSARVAPAPLNVRRAAVLAELAWERWQRGAVDDPLSLAPIYPVEAAG